LQALENHRPSDKILMAQDNNRFLDFDSLSQEFT